MFDLTGRTALVPTGATGGIGPRQPSRGRSHAHGATVAISGTQKRIEMLDGLAGQLGGCVHIGAVHISPTGRMVESLRPGGGSRPRPPLRHPGEQRRHHGATTSSLRMKDEERDQLLAVDLTAAFRHGACRRCAAHECAPAGFGRIIAITSVVGVTGNAGQANYAAAKAGMIGMSKSLAQEVASRSVTVNAIGAGLHRNGDDQCAHRQAGKSLISRAGAGRPAQVPAWNRTGGRRLPRLRTKAPM